MRNVTVLERYGIFLLVLAAVAALVYIMIRLIQNFTQERMEESGRAPGGANAANGVYYFISRGMLLQIQVSAGFLLGGSAVGILLFCQIYNPLIFLPAGGLFFCAGAALPWFYFSRKAAARAARFEESILDLSLGLTSALKAGQALPQALEVFSRRCEGPMKEELLTAIREYRLGLDLSEALQRVYNRLPCEDLQLLIVSIKLTTQSGGSLADVLQRITQTIQGRTEFHQKLRALTAQGRFEALAMSLAPLVAFLLLFFINNDLMLPMVQTAIGWAAIGIMLTLEFIGYVVIRKIVDIKV